MARDFMCQWASCQEEGPDLPVTVVYRMTKLKGDTERSRFCCLEHAALWCAKRAGKGAAVFSEAGG